MSNNVFKTGSAPISRIVLTFIIGIAIIIIINVTFGWSLGQTNILTTIALGPGPQALGMAWLIQLGPNLLFAMTSIVDNKGAKNGFVIGGIALNLIDTATNIGAYAITKEGMLYPPNVLPSVISLGHVLGYLACFFVTWGEEAIIYLVALLLDVVAAIMDDFGYKPPNWMHADVVGATGMPQYKKPSQKQHHQQSRKAKPPQRQGSQPLPTPWTSPQRHNNTQQGRKTEDVFGGFE